MRENEKSPLARGTHGKARDSWTINSIRNRLDKREEAEGSSLCLSRAESEWCRPSRRAGVIIINLPLLETRHDSA